MNEPALLLNGQPVAIVHETEAFVHVTDGQRYWWVEKECVRRVL